MIKLIKNGKIKLVSEQTVKLVGSRLDGWQILYEPKPILKAKKKVVDATNPNAVNEPTREEMLQFLLDKGIKMHHKTGDENVKLKYYAELNID